jgi:hypothetical protein
LSNARERRYLREPACLVEQTVGVHRTTQTEVHDVVEAFTNEPDCSLMLVSFGAGYSGLNLTMASQVVIMDPSSDPRVEAKHSRLVEYGGLASGGRSIFTGS